MVKLTDVTGIGPATLKILAEHKIKTVEALAALSVADLLKLHGFSDVRARAVKKAAAECLRKANSSATAAKSIATPIKKIPVKKQTGAKVITAAKTEPAQAVVEEEVKDKVKVDKNKPDKSKKKNKSKDSDGAKKKKNKVKEKKKAGKKKSKK